MIKNDAKLWNNKNDAKYKGEAKHGITLGGTVKTDDSLQFRAKKRRKV